MTSHVLPHKLSSLRRFEYEMIVRGCKCPVKTANSEYSRSSELRVLIKKRLEAATLSNIRNVQEKLGKAWGGTACLLFKRLLSFDMLKQESGNRNR
jgi:hypothetical protein